MRMNDNKGFTLIELMLAIAVMAALVIVGLNAYQQKMQNNKIERAALQIQNWLQAGLAFRVNNKEQWPESTSQLIIQGYIRSFSNPWRTCVIDHPELCFEVMSSDPKKNFSVAMKLPVNVPHSDLIAQQIANRLPNASVEQRGTDYFIIADVPFPAYSSYLKDQIIIKGIYTIKNSADFSKNPDTKLPPISQIDCIKDDQIPKRFYSLSAFDGALSQRFMATIASVSIEESNDADPNKRIIVPVEKVSAITGNTKDSYGGTVTVIDACFPNNKPKSNKIDSATSNSYRY